MKLLDPFFVSKIETQRVKTVTIWNLTTHFSALSKIVAVVRYYHMRVKGMAACFAVPVLIITGCGVLFVHGFDLSHCAVF